MAAVLTHSAQTAQHPPLMITSRPDSCPELDQLLPCPDLLHSRLLPGHSAGPRGASDAAAVWGPLAVGRAVLERPTLREQAGQRHTLRALVPGATVEDHIPGRAWLVLPGQEAASTQK